MKIQPKNAWNPIAAQAAMQKLKGALESQKLLIQIEGYFHLTKTAPAYGNAILLRDLDLESLTREWIEERSSFSELVTKYVRLDNSVSSSWPAHYPVRTLAGSGPLTSGSNIFMFFPRALGLESDKEEDYFGFEFIDIWANIFRNTVFPCLCRAFAPASQFEAYSRLAYHLDRTVYLASVFHEIGHRLGSFRVSPARLPEMLLTGYHFDVLGELMTDSLLASQLAEFPELALFVFLQRLFWFPRRGYANAPTMAWVNSDGDSWIGAYLWNRARKNGTLYQEGGCWNFASERLTELFSSIVQDLNALSMQLVAVSTVEAQEAIVQAWMESEVDTCDGYFVLPTELIEIYHVCQDIPEFPPYCPPLSMHAENQAA